MRTRAAAVFSVALAGAACHAGDVRAPGEPVTAPVASIDVQPPAGEARSTAAAGSASSSASTETAPPPSGEPDTSEPPDESALPPVGPPTSSPAPPVDPCAARCTGNTICWVYEHRPPAPPAPADASALAGLWDDEDAGSFRIEVHCMPQSAHCPVGTSSMISRFVMVNGTAARWNTCTFFDGP